MSRHVTVKFSNCFYSYPSLVLPYHIIAVRFFYQSFGSSQVNPFPGFDPSRAVGTRIDELSTLLADRVAARLQCHLQRVVHADLAASRQIVTIHHLPEIILPSLRLCQLSFETLLLFVGEEDGEAGTSGGTDHRRRKS